MSAPGLKITNFHYGHMIMPAPQQDLREYPKYVHREGHLSVIVQNAEEEAALLSSVNSVVTTPPADYPTFPAAPASSGPEPILTLAPDNNEKAVLLALAKSKNIKVDARWRIEKIRAAMTAAQPKADG